MFTERTNSTPSTPLGAVDIDTKSQGHPSCREQVSLACSFVIVRKIAEALFRGLLTGSISIMARNFSPPITMGVLCRRILEDFIVKKKQFFDKNCGLFLRHDLAFVMGVAQGECSKHAKMKHGD